MNQIRDIIRLLEKEHASTFDLQGNQLQAKK